jgi:hypothetical protein
MIWDDSSPPRYISLFIFPDLFILQWFFSRLALLHAYSSVFNSHTLDESLVSTAFAVVYGVYGVHDAQIPAENTKMIREKYESCFIGLNEFISLHLAALSCSSPAIVGSHRIFLLRKSCREEID